MLRATLFVFVLVLLAACGGGGGSDSDSGSGGGNNGGGGGGSILTPDAALTASTQATLAQASNPDGAIADLAIEISRVYAINGDLNLASDTVSRAWLAALQNGADFQALWQSMLNAGSSVHTLVGATEHCNAGATIFFVNGIGNELADALNSREKLLGVLHLHNPNTPSCALKLFYNKSGLTSWNINIFCAVFGLVEGFLTDWQFAHQRTCVSGLGLTADLAEASAQWYEQAGKEPDFSDPDVLLLRQQIRDELAKGKFVILVGHSQGNFFIQQAVDGLSATDKQKVGVLAIASPANYSNYSSYGSFRHYTLENDAITNPVIIGHLSANGSSEFSRASTSTSFAIHSFVDSYLGFEESREAILDLFDAVAGDLVDGGGGGSIFDEVDDSKPQR